MYSVALTVLLRGEGELSFPLQTGLNRIGSDKIRNDIVIPQLASEQCLILLSSKGKSTLIPLETDSNCPMYDTSGNILPYHMVYKLDGNGEQSLFYLGELKCQIRTHSHNKRDDETEYPGATVAITEVQEEDEEEKKPGTMAPTTSTTNPLVSTLPYHNTVPMDTQNDVTTTSTTIPMEEEGLPTVTIRLPAPHEDGEKEDITTRDIAEPNMATAPLTQFVNAQYNNTATIPMHETEGEPSPSPDDLVTMPMTQYVGDDDGDEGAEVTNDGYNIQGTVPMADPNITQAMRGPTEEDEDEGNNDGSRGVETQADVGGYTAEEQHTTQTDVEDLDDTRSVASDDLLVDDARSSFADADEKMEEQTRHQQPPEQRTPERPRRRTDPLSIKTAMEAPPTVNSSTETAQRETPEKPEEQPNSLEFRVKSDESTLSANAPVKVEEDQTAALAINGPPQEHLHKPHQSRSTTPPQQQQTSPQAAAGARTSPPTLTAAFYTEMTVSELRDDLKKLGLDTKGKKKDLIERLLAFRQQTDLPQTATKLPIDRTVLTNSQRAAEAATVLGTLKKDSAADVVQAAVTDYSVKQVEENDISVRPTGRREMGPASRSKRPLPKSVEEEQQTTPTKSSSKKSKEAPEAEQQKSHSPNSKRSSKESGGNESGVRGKKTMAAVPAKESTPTPKRPVSSHSTASSKKQQEAAIRVMFTGVEPSETQVGQVKKLGGELVSSDSTDYHSLTHLICAKGSMKRTLKLMHVMAIPSSTSPRIVHIGWLTDSTEQGKILDSHDYAPFEGRDSMKDALKLRDRDSSGGLLYGLTILVAEKGVAPSFKDLKPIIAEAGGIALLATESNLQECFPKSTVVIVADDGSSLTKKLQQLVDKRKLACCKPSWISQSIASYSLKTGDDHIISRGSFFI
jgi:hypothetical protein